MRSDCIELSVHVEFPFLLIPGCLFGLDVSIFIV
jgi:hypothetical protein